MNQSIKNEAAKRLANSTKQDFKLSFAISLQRTQFEAIASADLNVVEKMTEMATLGFDGVELAIRDPSAIDLSKIKRGLELSSLKVPCFPRGSEHYPLPISARWSML